VSIMLPSDLAWVLNLCGFMWPNVDEDKLRACAVTDRTLAANVNTAHGHHEAAAAIIATRNKGLTASAYGAHAKKVTVHLENLKNAYNITADALDAIADVIEGAKIAVIAQLAALAAEIAAAAAASIVTFGLSDAAGLAATALTKITLQEILDEMEAQVIKLAEGVLFGTALNAVLASVASLAEQATQDYVGTGSGVSVTAAAKAGGSAAAQSV
jgi:collagen type III alpha